MIKDPSPYVNTVIIIGKLSTINDNEYTRSIMLANINANGIIIQIKLIINDLVSWATCLIKHLYFISHLFIYIVHNLRIVQLRLP
jgi:hypothetical protein